MTEAELKAAQNVEGLNLVQGDGQQSTLTVGPTGGIKDSFTRYLVAPGDLTIQLNNPSAIYHQGDTITAIVNEAKKNGPVWYNGLTACLPRGPGRERRRAPQANTPSPSRPRPPAT